MHCDESQQTSTKQVQNFFRSLIFTDLVWSGVYPGRILNLGYLDASLGKLL
jgi:hypothetical protein